MRQAKDGETMKITKKCKNLKSAEKNQNKLYSQYNFVKLVSFPYLMDEGYYSWDVSEPRNV